MMMMDNALAEADLAQVRRTPDGLRIDGPGLVAALLGQRTHQGAPWKRLLEAHPQLCTECTKFKFPGRGSRGITVVDAKTAVKIVMVLPGRAAAASRERMATVVCRYLGGDLSLIEEVRQLDAAHRHNEEQQGSANPLMSAFRANAQQHQQDQQSVPEVQEQQYSPAVHAVAALFEQPPVILAAQSEEWLEGVLSTTSSARAQAASIRAKAEMDVAEELARGDVERAKLDTERVKTQLELSKAEAADARSMTRKLRAEARIAEAGAVQQLTHRLPRRAAASPRPSSSAQRRRTRGIPLRGRVAINNLLALPVPPGLERDPDLEGYRAAGIPDGARPASPEEAECWRQLVSERKKHIISVRRGVYASLVHRGERGIGGLPAPPDQWEPQARELLLLRGDDDVVPATAAAA